MKGLILSGGRGTGLRPLACTSARQSMRAVNTPILSCGTGSLAATIRGFGAVVEHRSPRSCTTTPRTGGPRSSTDGCSRAARATTRHRLEGSLIGKDVRNSPLLVNPSAPRFMQGDDSTVGNPW